MQLSLDTLSAIAFYVILIAIFIVFRKKIKIIQGIVIGFTTKKFNKFLKKVGSHQKLWKWVGNFAILISILGMIFISYYLVKVAYLNLHGHKMKSFGIVLPGIHIPGSPIYIPFWYGIISIFILVTVHEFSHAIMAFAEKIKIKSVGFGLLLLFPVAFVQPDEKKFEKSKGISRARVAAMGPFANIVLALLAFSLVLALVHFASNSFYVAAYPLNESLNFSEGVRVYEVNGVAVHFPEDVIKAIGNSTEVNLVTSEGNFSYKITKSPHVLYKLEANNVFVSIIYQFLNWLENLSLAIGLVNLLPIALLDGGLMLDGLLEKLIKEREIRAKLIFSLTLIFSSLLVFDLIMSYI